MDRRWSGKDKEEKEREESEVYSVGFMICGCEADILQSLRL